VKDPAEALEAARRAAAARGSAAGAQAEPDWPLEDPAAAGRRLVQWAIIEPDQTRIYSTRRYGRPVTWLKRGLIRLLRQYFDQVTAQQSRFNAQVAAQVLRLEERVAALERTIGDDDDGATAPDRPAR